MLSGRHDARLFTEVREKRGLCYSVGVRHETFKDRGTMVGYAGTGADRAQQTLDVTVGELRRLKEGVTDDEIDRVKAGLKSSLIMQEESTSARAGAIATDWYLLGRVRSFDEIQAPSTLTPKAWSTTWRPSRPGTHARHARPGTVDDRGMITFSLAMAALR